MQLVISNRLEKVAIAMHCNLRLSDVAPVVLSFMQMSTTNLQRASA